MNKPKLTLDLYDYHNNVLCPLYDSESNITGQAYDVHIQTERNGWKELSFKLPAKIQTESGEEDNFRIDLLKSDYKIRSEDEKEIDWFIVNKDTITHKAMSKEVSIVAGHVSQLLKLKNLDLEFNDEEGNNVGTAEMLLGTVLKGTGWSVGYVASFLEDDGSVKYRSLKVSSKTGSFKLITSIADLFEAKPIFHGDSKTVDLIPMNPFTQDDDDVYPDVTDADVVMELHYGVNVSNVSRTIDSSNIATKLHVYGSYGDKTYGYCSIDECVHSIRSMKITTKNILTTDGVCYFELEDDSGTIIKRHFTPEYDIRVGEHLVFSFLDPASMLYVWHQEAKIVDDDGNYVYDDNGDQVLGAAYPCYEGASGIQVNYELETVTPEWTNYCEDGEIVARTQIIPLDETVMHHWSFPDSSTDNVANFRIDVYKTDTDITDTIGESASLSDWYAAWNDGEATSELDETYSGSDIKFDVGCNDPETEKYYYIEVKYRLSTVNYTQDEINDLINERNKITASCSAKYGSINWFNFLMDFDYYRENNMLTEENVKTIAEYQKRAPDYYEEAYNASLAMSKDMNMLTTNIGTINFCRLKIAGVDPIPDTDDNGVQRERLRIDKTDEYPDGVIYRTDYYLTNKNNYFKWYGTPALNTDGNQISGIASLLYIIHDNGDDPITWDKAYIYNDRKDNKTGLLEDPDYLILHAEPGKINFNFETDKIFLLQHLGTTGYLGAYESADEAAAKALRNITTLTTVEHPVYFGTVGPTEITDSERAAYNSLGNFVPFDEFLDQEYSWYWQYDPKGIEDSKMYFCFKSGGDEETTTDINGKTRGIYYYVYYTDTEPTENCKDRQYWFNYKTSKLYRYSASDFKWVLLESYLEKDIAATFGSVHQECMHRDAAYRGYHAHYTYEVPEDTILEKGSYYIENEVNSAWVFTTTRDLPAGSKLTFSRKDACVYQICGTNSTSLITKNKPLDAVFYHPNNLFDYTSLVDGWIDETGAIDDTNTDYCYTKATMYCYPNTPYVLTGLNGYDYRVIEYSESNTNKMFVRYHDHVYGDDDYTTFISGVSSTYLRVCIKTTAETVNTTCAPILRAVYKDSCFVVDNINYIRLDNITNDEDDDVAGILPAMKIFNEYADKVYLTDYNKLRSAQNKINEVLTNMNDSLGDMLREGYWQDTSYVDGDEEKLYTDALKKMKTIAKPELKYSIKYIDHREADLDDSEHGVIDITRNVKWPWLTTESAVHLLDPEINVDAWAYIDKINRCYDDPKKTTIDINTNLSTITQHTFGDVLSNIADVAYETRTSSMSELRRLLEGMKESNDISMIYQQQQESNANSLSSTLSSLQTTVADIRENYIQATSLSNYSTIEQTSEAITSTVTSIQSNISGGANLIKESNFFLYKTNADSASTVYRLDLADEYTTNVFANQYMTLSYYLDVQGERAQLLGNDGQFDNYFGAGLVVIWGSSATVGNNVRDDTVKYYLFDLCEVESTGRRICVTDKIEPPDEAYDVIKDIYVSVQLTSKPAKTNEKTWTFGQPQLEVGKFCTGYKESAFEIKSYATSQIKQTAEEISAQVSALKDEYDTYAKVSISADGIVSVVQTVEGSDDITGSLDLDPYSHPITQWAWTKRPTIVPKEEQWQETDIDYEKPYVWTRTVIKNNGTVVSATSPVCVDSNRESYGSILSASDQYCYVEGNTTPTGDDEWIDEYQGEKDGYTVWIQTHILYNTGESENTVPEKLSISGLKNVDVYYAVSDDPDSISADAEWTLTIDDIVNQNKYAWTKVVYTYNNGTTEEMEPTRLGSNTSRTIESVDVFYYTSTEASLTVDEIENYANWTSNIDYKSGSVIWSRNRITFNDKSVVWSDPQKCTAYNALYQNDDITINVIEIRYAVNDSDFVPPADNAEWTTSFPSASTTDQCIWYSPWTWCENGNVYRGIPVYLTNNAAITDITANWAITEGNTVPSDDSWNNLSDTSYIDKLAVTTDNDNTEYPYHMWISIAYMDGEEVVVSDLARARYYDNLLDGPTDLHKSYEALLDDRYVRKLYSAEYDHETGSTIQSDVSAVEQTAKGIYQYLVSNDETAMSSFEAGEVYTGLTNCTTGAISEIRQTADEIIQSVGGISKNMLSNSSSVAVIDYERDNDDVIECALNDGKFDINNSASSSSDTVADLVTGAVITTTVESSANDVEKSLGSVSRNIIIYYNGNSTTVDRGDQNKTVISSIPIPKTNSDGNVEVIVGPVRLSTSNGAVCKVRVYYTSSDYVAKEVNVYSRSATGTSTTIEIKRSEITASMLTIAVCFYQTPYNVSDSYTSTVVMDYIKYTVEEQTGSTYIPNPVTLLSESPLFENSNVISYTLSGNMTSSNGALKLYARDDTDTTINERDRIIEEFDVTSSGEFSIDLLASKFASSGATSNVFSIIAYPSLTEGDTIVDEDLQAIYKCILSNLVLTQQVKSVDQSYKIPLTDPDIPLTAGNKYTFIINSGYLSSDSTTATGINIQIPGVTDLYTVAIDPESGNLIADDEEASNVFEITIDSLSKSGVVYAYAGLNGSTGGVHLQLGGVSILKYPKYISTEIASVNIGTSDNLILKNSKYIFSVNDIVNNNYTLSYDGSNYLSSTNLLNEIAVDRVTCEIINYTTNTVVATDDFEVRSRNSESISQVQFISFDAVADNSYYIKLYSGTVSGSKHGGSVTYKNIQLEEVDDKNEEIDGVIQPTNWKIKVGEADGTLTNSSIIINNDGIKATGGTVDIQAGSIFNVGSQGIVKIASDNEESSITFGVETVNTNVIDEKTGKLKETEIQKPAFYIRNGGELYSKNASFDNLTVGGKAITYDMLEAMINTKINEAMEEYFIRKEKASELTLRNMDHGYYWLEPNGTNMLAGKGETTIYGALSNQKIIADSRSLKSTFNIRFTGLTSSLSDRIKYQLKFTIYNNTSELNNGKSMFMRYINVYAKGYNKSGVMSQVLVYSYNFESSDTGSVPIGRNIARTVNVVSEFTGNVAALGTVTFEVQIQWGSQQYIDFVGYVTAADVTLYVPPVTTTVSLGDVSAVNYNVYYIPKGYTVQSTTTTENTDSGS